MDAFLTMNKKWFKVLNSFDFLIILSAFLYGNLFAIHNSNLNWNIFLIFSIVFGFEFINQTVYFIRYKFSKNQIFVIKYKLNFCVDWILKSKFKSIFESVTKPKEDNNLNFLILINTLKRGFLLGFFLEAFKVGS
jgi:hypothetical protein